ncbi:hypothetical protein SAY86_026751 [Trapa natans]|uniref:Uncharacterized protein n=1 Tax=Trapa natans TaxID=22666 RepID=A0AAN7QEU8_TRANT|nr:hypothetical protein SAY86_026751 [Trapa natans]
MVTPSSSPSLTVALSASPFCSAFHQEVDSGNQMIFAFCSMDHRFSHLLGICVSLQSSSCLGHWLSVVNLLWIKNTLSWLTKQKENISFLKMKKTQNWDYKTNLFLAMICTVAVLITVAVLLLR